MWQYLYGIDDAVVQRCSVTKMFLKISQNLHENTCAKGIFSKRAGQRPAYLYPYKTEAPAQVYSGEFARFYGIPIL